MFADDHYVPILKGRAAEFDALKEAPERERLGLTPLIEVVPVQWDYAEERPTKTLDAHLDGVVQKLANSWGHERRAFVDLGHLPADARDEGSAHPVRRVLRAGRLADGGALRLVPVLSLASDDDFRAAIRDEHDGAGAVLRVTSSDLAGSDAAASIAETLDALGLRPEDVDLLVDLGALKGDDDAFNLIAAVGVLAFVPDAEGWRTLTVAGSSFPDDLSGVSPSSEERFPRAEWTMWESLRGRGDVVRKPTFADYAIASPGLPPGIDPRFLRISAQLRYSTPEDWLVFKERNIRDHGSEQFIDICKRLVKRDEFRGAAFSWGDAYIAARADGSETTPGNPMMWRKVGTSHHIATVIDQIANLGT